MQYFVYILRCSDRSLYTGWTKNLKKRVIAHNTLGSGARYTRSRRPVVLVYSESCESLSEALQREHALKKLTRKQKLEIIRSLKNSEEEILKNK